MTAYIEATENVKFRNSTVKKKKALKFIRLHQLAENNNSFIRLNHSLAFPFNKKQQSTGCSQPKTSLQFLHSSSF